MHNYSSLLYHLTFATLNRQPLVNSSFRDRLHAYLGGIARSLGAKPLEIGGVADHVHLMLEMKPTMPVAEVIGKLKSNSSKWLHDSSICRRFEWQRGYGAFTIRRCDVPTVGRYILEQEEHHRVRTFEEEFRELLQDHGIELDERYFFR